MLKVCALISNAVVAFTASLILSSFRHQWHMCLLDIIITCQRWNVNLILKERSFSRFPPVSISFSSRHSFSFLQSLLRDRRGRVSTIVDHQTGIRQTNSSLGYRPTDRTDVKRSDQICAYPRRSYVRQASRYSPYVLTSPAEQKTPKVDAHESSNSVEEKPVEHINHDPVHLNDDQVVIPEDSSVTSKVSRRRSMNNSLCPHCKLKFKTKHLLNTHLSLCHSDIERRWAKPKKQKKGLEFHSCRLVNRWPAVGRRRTTRYWSRYWNRNLYSRTLNCIRQG